MHVLFIRVPVLTEGIPHTFHNALNLSRMNGVEGDIGPRKDADVADMVQEAYVEWSGPGLGAG